MVIIANAEGMMVGIMTGMIEADIMEVDMGIMDTIIDIVNMREEGCASVNADMGGTADIVIAKEGDCVNASAGTLAIDKMV